MSCCSSSFCSDTGSGFGVKGTGSKVWGLGSGFGKQLDGLVAVGQGIRDQGLGVRDLLLFSAMVGDGIAD